MRIFLVLAALVCLAPASWAAAPKPRAKEKVLTGEELKVEAPAEPKGPDKIVLKDGQKLEGRIKGYDAFFLEVEAQNGTKFNLPWKEIMAVTPFEATGDTAMMQQYLSADSVAVSSAVEAKLPSRAFGRALWPGILIHGMGYKEAGDQDMFLSLAGAELFGALVAGFGLSKTMDSGVSQGDKDTAQYLVIGGGAAFALSWIWDLAGSAHAANAFNKRHGLSLAPLPLQGGAALVASRSF